MLLSDFIRYAGEISHSRLTDKELVTRLEFLQRLAASNAFLHMATPVNRGFMTPMGHLSIYNDDFYKVLNDVLDFMGASLE